MQKSQRPKGKQKVYPIDGSDAMNGNSAAMTSGTYCRRAENEEASLTPALALNDYGCFVPDLTRFTAEPCEGARQRDFNRSCRLAFAAVNIVYERAQIEYMAGARGG